MVIFIYRDEVYNEETEQKNIAELIVAKHRNGPVGRVSLFFNENLTSFGNLKKVTIPLGEEGIDEYGDEQSII